MEDEKVQELLFEAFGSIDVNNQILDKYFLMDSEDFLRSTIDYDRSKIYVFYGLERRIQIAKKKASKRLDEMPEHYFVDVKKIKEFFTPFVEGSPLPSQQEDSGTKDAPQAMPTQDGDIETEAVQESVGEESVEHIQDQEEEVKPLAPEFKETPGAGMCRYGVPIIPVKRHAPNVLGLQESLTQNVTQEELDAFFNKVKGRVLAKI